MSAERTNERTGTDDATSYAEAAVGLRVGSISDTSSTDERDPAHYAIHPIPAITYGPLTAAQTEEAFCIGLAARKKLVRSLAPRELAALLLARRLAAQSLLHFIRYTNDPSSYYINWHHAEIAAYLQTLIEDVEGRNNRLIVASCPRSGKSRLGVLANLWAWGRNPSWDLVYASYSEGLAATFGRQFRAFIRDAGTGFHEVFPGCMLLEDAQSITEMRSTEGGSAYFCGVGSGLTGRGAHLATIDDSLSGWEAANSVLVRNALHEWFRGTLRTRMAPKGRIAVISTRWHAQDLSGVLKAESDAGTGERYIYINYPALNEQGEPLWPQRFDAEEVRRIREAVGAKTFRFLYQGDAREDESGFFRRDWLERRHVPGEVPFGARMLCATDFAISAGSGDASVHAIMAITSNVASGYHEYAVLDMVRGHWSFEESVTQLIILLQKFRNRHGDRNSVQFWIAEADSIVLTGTPYIKQRFYASGLRPHFLRVSKQGNKAAKAASLQGALEYGRVSFPEGAPWVKETVDEFIEFDGESSRPGVDDRVDCLSVAVRAAIQFLKPRNPDNNVYQFPGTTMETYDPRLPFGGHVSLGPPSDTSMVAKLTDRDRI